MIAGEFDQGGQPRLEAEVILPAFGFTRHVSFVVDTGAARTTLTARDFAPVRAEVIRFQPEILASGFGGPVMGVRELGLITLHEPAAGWHRFQLTVNLSPSGTALPSVLGRDVLSRCTMWWDPVGRRLEFNVLESDAFAPEA